VISPPPPAADNARGAVPPTSSSPDPADPLLELVGMMPLLLASSSLLHSLGDSSSLLLEPLPAASAAGGGAGPTLPWSPLPAAAGSGWVMYSRIAVNPGADYSTLSTALWYVAGSTATLPLWTRLRSILRCGPRSYGTGCLTSRRRTPTGASSTGTNQGLLSTEDTCAYDSEFPSNTTLSGTPCLPLQVHRNVLV